MRNAFLVIFILMTAVAFGQSSFSSDRPGQSYSPLSLELHEIQMQQGFQWEDFPNGDIISQRIISSSTFFRYGLGSGLEVGLGYYFDYINQPQLDNLFNFNDGQPWLSLRYSLSKASDPLQVGFLALSNFDALDVRANASLALETWTLSGNLGIYSDRDVSYTVQWTLNLAYSKENWGAFAEVYGLALNSANRDYLAFDAGFAFPLSPNFQLDVFAGNQIGIGPAVGLFNSYFINTGFSWRIR